MDSYRRILLDKDLESSKRYMRGVTLDIGGGRKRGRFVRNEDARWIIIDINNRLCPDIIADAHRLPARSASIDCIKCTELLEHVDSPEGIIAESARVLKPGGILILSVPFLYPLHGDPNDFQRLSDDKIRRLLAKDYNVLDLHKQGLYFTVLSGMLKQPIINAPPYIRIILYPFIILLDILTGLDQTDRIKKSKFFSSYTTGFFAIAEKRRI